MDSDDDRLKTRGQAAIRRAARGSSRKAVMKCHKRGLVEKQPATVLTRATRRQTSQPVQYDRKLRNTRRSTKAPQKALDDKVLPETVKSNKIVASPKQTNNSKTKLKVVPQTSVVVNSKHGVKRRRRSAGSEKCSVCDNSDNNLGVKHAGVGDKAGKRRKSGVCSSGRKTQVSGVGEASVGKTRGARKRPDGGECESHVLPSAVVSPCETTAVGKMCDKRSVKTRRSAAQSDGSSLRTRAGGGRSRSTGVAGTSRSSTGPEASRSNKGAGTSRSNKGTETCQSSKGAGTSRPSKRAVTSRSTGVAGTSRSSRDAGGNSVKISRAQEKQENCSLRTTRTGRKSAGGRATTKVAGEKHEASVGKPTRGRTMSKHTGGDQVTTTRAGRKRKRELTSDPEKQEENCSSDSEDHGKKICKRDEKVGASTGNQVGEQSVSGSPDPQPLTINSIEDICAVTNKSLAFLNSHIDSANLPDTDAMDEWEEKMLGDVATLSNSEFPDLQQCFALYEEVKKFHLVHLRTVLKYMSNCMEKVKKDASSLEEQMQSLPQDGHTEVVFESFHALVKDAMSIGEEFLKEYTSHTERYISRMDSKHESQVQGLSEKYVTNVSDIVKTIVSILPVGSDVTTSSQEEEGDQEEMGDLGNVLLSAIKEIVGRFREEVEVFVEASQDLSRISELNARRLVRLNSKMDLVGAECKEALKAYL